MRTWTLSADVTAGALESMVVDVTAGQVVASVSQGRWCAVSAAGDKPPGWMFELLDHLRREGTACSLD